MENPKIALAVLVENAGFGGAISAPIARELIKYFIKGREKTVSLVPGGIKASKVEAQPDSTESSSAVQPEKPAQTTEPATETTIENNTGNAVE